MGIDSAVNVEAVRQLAQRRLPRLALDYVEGGADDEITLRRNVEAMEELMLLPRVLRDVSGRSCRTTIFGVPSALPAVVGPTGMAGMCWRHGDLELARASAAFGVPFALSTVSNDTIEDVRKAAPDGRLWLQLYLFKERRVSEALVARAEAAGFEAILLTVDVPVPARREREWRNGMRMPLKLTWAVKLNMLLYPRWLFSVGFRQPRFVNVERELPDQPGVFIPSLFDPAVTWDDVAKLRERWKGKLLLKGVLRADDAVHAASLGVDGVVVSNHGGRQLDGAPAAIEVLPEVVREISSRCAVWVDGGVRRGADVAKAVALGAQGVLLGRAPLWGLGAAGERGVRKVLEILHGELDRALALTGCADLSQLTADLVRR